MLLLALTTSLALHAVPTHAPVRLDVERATRLALFEEPYRGGPVPEGARIERRDNDWLIGGGMVASLGSYLLSLTAASSIGFLNLVFLGDTSVVLLAIPFAGPALAALQPLTFAGENAPLLRGLYYADAVLQLGGAIVALHGYLTRGFVVVYDEPQEQVRAQLLPGAAGATAGTTLLVTF